MLGIFMASMLISSIVFFKLSTKSCALYGRTYITLANGASIIGSFATSFFSSFYTSCYGTGEVASDCPIFANSTFSLKEPIGQAKSTEMTV
jgi:hypothetical protein